MRARLVAGTGWDGLDPAEAAIVVFNYLTAYQMLHRTARVKQGERLLVHGAAGGVGTAVLQLGRIAGLELYGTGSAMQTGVISALGATPIDYTKGSFVERIRELTGAGVDVVLDGIGGSVALGSYRALRRGGRLVMYGHYGTTIGGRKSARRVGVFYLLGTLVFAGNLLPNGKRVLTFQVAKLRDRRPTWFREDATALFELRSPGPSWRVCGGLSANESSLRVDVKRRKISEDHVLRDFEALLKKRGAARRR